MKLYLAGPMSGIPQFNFPAFDYASKTLRRLGYSIVSPHELDSDKVKKEAIESTDGALINGKIGGETWGEILAKDVKIIADDVDGIVFLPFWFRSRGARLEAFTALLAHKHKFFYYKDNNLYPTDVDEIRNTLINHMP